MLGGQLGTVLPVDLVAVVLLGVVTGGDVDTGDAAVLPHREGQLRGGTQGLEQAHGDAVARHDTGGLPGKDVGVVAAVEADGHPPGGGLGPLLQDDLGKGLGGVADDMDIHPVQPHPHGAPQARGRGIRNVRTGMNVPPSKKAKVFVVSESENVRNTFENGKVFFATLGSASEVTVQADRSGIDEDAVSAVLPEAVIYMPFAELVDIDKEIERLQKEEQRLTKELARVNGMLSNERFMSKAPESKVAEERAKLEKYSQMMDQVKERLTHLQAR